MPLKLSVGLAKKIGQPNYGSLGASCSVELELESSLLQTDLGAFQHRVRQAFMACRQAVQDELVRQQIVTLEGPCSAWQPGNSSPESRPNENLDGLANPASRRQLEYAQQLLGKIGTGAGDLESIAERLLHKSASQLSASEASRLISLLRDVKAGKLELDSLVSVASL